MIPPLGWRRPLFLLGTRPEAIKLAPLVIEARRRGLEAPLVSTGQHRDMVAPTLAAFGLTPDRDLGLMVPNQTLEGLTARVLLAVSELLHETKPDLLVVQGDTTTVLAGALAAFYAGIASAHVEAGLRTGEARSPYPEEMNRRVTGQLAALHLAPTHRAAEALRAEGLERYGARIVVTGNPVIDALFMARTAAAELVDPHETVRHAREWKRGAPGRRLVLVTGHRRENFGPAFESFCLGIRDLAEAHPEALVVYPVHLNPNVQEPVRRLLSATANVQLAPVLDYLNFVAVMCEADLIITDSGGVQEEAPALGIPVVVTRESTERPEALASGGVVLAGPRRERIVAEAERLLKHSGGARIVSPYGDGKAAARCLDAIQGIDFQEFGAV